MLVQLRIKNLVLIEECDVSFDKGLSIITGETGAGKTALLQGLQLILGQRADISYLRKGADKASVQASFSVEEGSPIPDILDRAGLSYEPEEYLLISREISLEGKSRAFINNQMVSLSLLQKVGSHLIHLIGQHSYHELKSSDTLRSVLDLFGGLKEPIQKYETAYEEEKRTKAHLDELLSEAERKEKELERCRDELKELDAAKLKEGEEEALFEEYSFFSKAQEIAEKSSLICAALSDSSNAIIPKISQFKSMCEQLSPSHEAFKECETLLHEALVPLQEAYRTLQQKFSHIDCDPKRYNFLEERLSFLNRIKKKYGNTYSDCMIYREQLEEKISDWERFDERLEKAQEASLYLAAEVEQLCCELSDRRKATAEKLEKILSREIQSLNMQGATISIEIQKQPRSQSGEDHVIFWLTANKGERPVSIKESSSGGELSRILLAIKAVLAEKNNTPTIIFDEVDANVGGKTASIIGEKLQALSCYRQVFCITHFPQVASCASTHFRVLKEEIDGRTIARLKKLNTVEKNEELLRMLGGKNHLPLKA